jgi:hypothetical protein
MDSLRATLLSENSRTINRIIVHYNDAINHLGAFMFWLHQASNNLFNSWGLIEGGDDSGYMLIAKHGKIPLIDDTRWSNALPRFYRKTNQIDVVAAYVLRAVCLRCYANRIVITISAR